MTTRAFPPTLLLLLLSAACSEGPPPGEARSVASGQSALAPLEPAGTTLARVNGVPIRVADVHYVLAKENRGRSRGADAMVVKATLEKVIAQELARQQAVAEGLDRNEAYQRKLYFMEAPAKDFARSELAEALETKAAAEAAPDDTEARAYFDANAERYRTEVHLLQLLVRGDRDRIEALKGQLDGGTPFAEVAATLFPHGLPGEGRPPWDLGFLALEAVPGEWQGALSALKPGEVSGIIDGPKERAWILKLVERRVDESLDFDRARDAVLRDLSREKNRAAHAHLEQSLRARADIVYVDPPEAMPAAPDGDEDD